MTLADESRTPKATLMGIPAKLQIPDDAEVQADLSRAIADSRRLLDLPDDWDEMGSPALDEQTWNRATELLRRQASKLWDRRGLVLPVPRILPGPDGSVDIHWKSPRRELLINIPSDNSAPITFYGDDYGQDKKKGQIDEGALPMDLFAWLTAAG